MFVILLSIQLYIVEYVDDIQRTKTTTRQTLSRPGSALLLCPYIRSTPIHVALACAHVLSLSHAWLSLSLSPSLSRARFLVHDPLVSISRLLVFLSFSAAIPSSRLGSSLAPPRLLSPHLLSSHVVSALEPRPLHVYSSINSINMA